MELNPENPAANAAMGRALFSEARWGDEAQSPAREANLREALEHTRTAVQLAHYDPEIRWRYINMLRIGALDPTEPCDGGCWQATLDQLRIRYRADTTDREVVCFMIEPLVLLDQLDEATQRVDELRRLDEAGELPPWPWCRARIHLLNLARGEMRLALEALHPILATNAVDKTVFFYNRLLDIGAHEAVLRWADHMVERWGMPARNYASAAVRHANQALGRFEATRAWIDSLVDYPESSRYRSHTANRFYQLGTLPPGDPLAIAVSAELDSDCDGYEAEFKTPDGYVIPQGDIGMATICLLHSIRQSRPRERLAEALPRALDEQPPYRGHEIDPGPLWKTVVQAALGDSEAALETFRGYVDNGFRRPYLLRLWWIHGGPVDLTNGLSSHPEFRALVDEIEADIETNAPWLFDPSINRPEPSEAKVAADETSEP